MNNSQKSRMECGPYDPDELVRWAENYGHPEGWAKRAQELQRIVDADMEWRRSASGAAERLRRLEGALQEIASYEGLLDSGTQWKGEHAEDMRRIARRALGYAPQHLDEPMFPLPDLDPGLREGLDES